MFSTQTKDTATSVKNEDHSLLSDRHIAFQLIGGGNNIHQCIICCKVDIFQKFKPSSKSEHTENLSQMNIVSYVFKSESKGQPFITYLNKVKQFNETVQHNNNRAITPFSIYNLLLRNQFFLDEKSVAFHTCSALNLKQCGKD